MNTTAKRDTSLYYDYRANIIRVRVVYLSQLPQLSGNRDQLTNEVAHRFAEVATFTVMAAANHLRVNARSITISFVGKLMFLK